MHKRRDDGTQPTVLAPLTPSPARMRAARAFTLTAVIFLVALFPVIATISCSGKPPSIAGFRWHLVDTSAFSGISQDQALSCFAVVQDGDGLEDIESLFLANDSAEIVWKLAKGEWSQRMSDGMTWIGRGDFRPPEGAIPEGMYRFIVQDASGETIERSFYVNKAVRSALEGAKATLTASGGNATIASSLPNTELVACDSNGLPLANKRCSPGTLGMQAYFSDQPAAAFATGCFVIAWDDSASVSVISRMVPIK